MSSKSKLGSKKDSKLNAAIVEDATSTKKKRVTNRSGLCLSVQHTKSLLQKKNVAIQYTQPSLISVTAIVEYLIQDLLNACQSKVKKGGVITPEIILQVIKDDAELNNLFEGCQFNI